MNIEIKVDDVTLSTIVADVYAYDEEGEPYQDGTKTIADLVAAQIVTLLVKDDRWTSLREQVTQIRKEEIRAAVRPSIDEALAKPIHKTNSYGERTGQETTLAEIIVEEARKQLAEPADRYRNEKGTVLQQTVRAEVTRAFETEIADAVQQLRHFVTEEFGGDIAGRVMEGFLAGLKK